MNQILVTKKLYVTPELKRKKKIYKFDFILSVILIIVLVSLYLYSEYDRNKKEAESKAILASLDATEDNTMARSDMLVAVLNDSANAIVDDEINSQAEEIISNLQGSTPKVQTYTEGPYTYIIDAKISIPKINVEYPVFLGSTGSIEETETLLKKSPCKFHGGEPNEVGNYCIVGHNYRNTKFFSKVPDLQNGDIIQLTDMSGANKGSTLSYSVYDKFNVQPDDVTCTSQLTNGQKELTLITCTDDSKERVIVKAREIK